MAACRGHLAWVSFGVDLLGCFSRGLLYVVWRIFMPPKSTSRSSGQKVWGLVHFFQSRVCAEVPHPFSVGPDCAAKLYCEHGVKLRFASSQKVRV